jgi:lysophospholipase L1-like esterase
VASSRRLFLSALVAAIATCVLFAPAAGATTVSLGDSFSSGEGTGNYDAGTSQEHGNGCDRSPDAWPRLLGVPKKNHFACSGATTADFYESTKDPVSQLSNLQEVAQREPISKVYVTIGGNDLGFGTIVGDCYVRTCLSHLDSVELPRLRDKVEPAVTRALEETKKYANGGQVILVGYPDLIPSPGSQFTNCGWLTDKEKPRVWKLESELESTLAASANAAGVTFIPISEALKGHELCTADSWVTPVASSDAVSHHGLVPGKSNHQGHPDAQGQKAMAAAVKRAENGGAGAVPPPPAGCTPATSVAAIVDDSGSMEVNDPLNIRRSALELLITKPSEQSRTLGAVEFGGEAGPLFSPAVVSANSAAMIGSLGSLRNDGYDDSGSETDYNAAFSASSAEQPGANARIFLTDGGHNVGPYENGHLGGPRTYVVGLNIGAAGEGNSEADLLGKIASDTGGYYFPLLRDPGDSAATQYTRLQPVFNAIDALLQCHGAPQQSVVKLNRVGAAAPPIHASFGAAAGLEVVISWAAHGTKAGMARASVRNAGGRVVANLSGKAPHGSHKHHHGKKIPAPEVLRPGVVEGPTFETITVPKPPHGANLQISVAASELAKPSAVSVQIEPLQTLPAGVPGAPQTGPAAGGGSTPAPAGPPTPPAPAPETPSGPPSNPTRINLYDNYGGGAAGHAMCRGNPGRPESMPGGVGTETFTVPANVASVDSALVQIDPDPSVTAHATLSVNGVAQASAEATAVGDTRFNFPSVGVRPGDSLSLTISFTATSGKIITLYTVGSPGGTFTASNSCSDGAPSFTTGDGLRAVISGWTP